jgi:hypothetical protein
MGMPIVEAPRSVTGGIGTDLDAHVAAVVDVNGGVLGVESFRRPRPGSPSCVTGSSGSARCNVSVSWAPVPTVPGLLATCGAAGSR